MALQNPASRSLFAIRTAFRLAADDAHPQIRVIWKIEIHDMLGQADLDRLIESKSRRQVIKRCLIPADIGFAIDAHRNFVRVVARGQWRVGWVAASDHRIGRVHSVLLHLDDGSLHIRSSFSGVQSRDDNQ